MSRAKRERERITRRDNYRARIASGERWFGRASDTPAGEPVVFDVVSGERFVLTEEIQKGLGVLSSRDNESGYAAWPVLIDKNKPYDVDGIDDAGVGGHNWSMMSSEAVVTIAKLSELTVPGAVEYFTLRLMSYRTGIAGGVNSPEWGHASDAWQRFLADGGSEAAAIAAAKVAIQKFKAKYPKCRLGISEPALTPQERQKEELRIRAKMAAAAA